MQGFCSIEVTATQRKEFDYGQQWLINACLKVTGSDCTIRRIHKQFMMIQTPNKVVDSHSYAFPVQEISFKKTTQHNQHVCHFVRNEMLKCSHVGFCLLGMKMFI